MRGIPAAEGKEDWQSKKYHKTKLYPSTLTLCIGENKKPKKKIKIN